MKGTIIKISACTVCFLSASSLLAQSGQSSTTSYLVYLLLAAAVLVFFVLVIQVSDNLMAIEAKQVGIDSSQANFSIFPAVGEIFSSPLPDYLDDKVVRKLRRGHDITLEGATEKSAPDDVEVTTYAVQPPNFIGIMPIPKVLVESGDEVKAGDPIFFDKKSPDIKYVAPVSGEIVAINRGAKRAITSIVILADKEIKHRKYKKFDLEKSDREELVNYLLDSGCWPLIRQRPFNVVPDPENVPRDIFISTFDTAPLAPDLNLIIEGRGEAFQRGLDVLNKLTSGKVHLGLDARSEQPPASEFIEAEGVEKHWFKGKHPAGNVGVQIHHINPISRGETVWTLGVQEVVTIGKLFLEQRFDAERVVALTGAELKEPRYVRTFMGAKLADLLKDNIKIDNVRIISGDVLSGEKKKREHFLNIFDDQVTVVEEGDYHELFGWLLPLKPRPSISRTFPNWLISGLTFKADTNTHGEKRAFVVTGDYERVLPMDIHVQHLMKAILINDFERMEGLGILELSEEDVALCEFVCVSKQPLQQILRKGLDTMREQT
ncbi:MAG: Na(+)-translocating NADH-quinone reductase subunit A [Saprospiraceae bacterium]|nr:Na(+)-translocating NADH-quinone reductase subunit A [Saprospiraceae bacterium]